MNIPIIKNKRFGRFALVGATSTLLDFGILFLLKSLGMPAIFANICSTTLSFLFNFTANKKYTFKTTGTNVVREMILFVVFALIGLWGLQSIVIHFTLDPLTNIFWNNKNIGLITSKLLATVVSLTWNYITYSRIVFKHAD